MRVTTQSIQPIVDRVRPAAARQFHRSRWFRNAMLAANWPKLHANTFDLAHLAWFEEELAVGPLQRDEALLLHAVVRVIRPAVVLELGFLRGRSALNFLAAVPPSSHLYAVDNDPHAQERARDVFDGVPNFHFIAKSQDEIGAADVGGAPIDLLFMDASHDVTLNQRTFERLLDLLAPNAIVAVHDTGSWPLDHFLPLHHQCVREGTEGEWISDTQFAHQVAERRFVNWIRETHPEFAQLHLHSERTVRHGLTLMQRSTALPVERS